MILLTARVGLFRSGDTETMVTFPDRKGQRPHLIKNRDNVAVGEIGTCFYRPSPDLYFAYAAQVKDRITILQNCI